MFRQLQAIALISMGMVLAWTCFPVLEIEAAGQSPRDIVLPVPKNMANQETLERVANGYEEQKKQLAELLIQLEQNRIDPLLDTPVTGLQKQMALKAWLDQFSSDLLTKTAETDLVTGYVFIKNEVTPRLSGKIVRIGPDKDYPTLEKAFPHLKKGDSVRLEPGSHAFPRIRNLGRKFETLSDLEFVGESIETTELEFGRGHSVSAPRRWRFSNVKINCKNSPFLEMRESGTVEIHGCYIFNYNSGAGGSNAIYGSNSVVLIENTEMEGDSGRASGSGGGSAFDLRGRNLFYSRKTQFAANDEVIRAYFPCVFDRCKFSGEDNWIFGDAANNVIARGGTPPTRRIRLKKFETALDDVKFIQFVLGREESLDMRSERIVQKLHLERNPTYWIGLMRHKLPAVRILAAEQVTQLLDKKVTTLDVKNSKALNERIEKLVQQLGAKEFLQREEAMQELEEIGYPAAAILNDIAQANASSLEQRERAKKLLDGLPDLPELVTDVECGRLLDWYESVRHQLEWDESKRQYVLPKNDQ